MVNGFNRKSRRPSFASPASVGTIMRSTQKWPLKTDELGIPNYTGAVLTGAYVAVDIAGPVLGPHVRPGRSHRPYAL